MARVLSAGFVAGCCSGPSSGWVPDCALVCCACFDIDTSNNIGTMISRGRVLLVGDVSLLGRRNLLLLVFGVVESAMSISVPEACVMYFFSSVPGTNASRIASHREQHGGAVCLLGVVVSSNMRMLPGMPPAIAPVGRVVGALARARSRPADRGE